MSLLALCRRHLLENVEASIVTWEQELDSAVHSGQRRAKRGLECRRVLLRLQRRRDRLVRKFGLEAGNDGRALDSEGRGVTDEGFSL